MKLFLPKLTAMAMVATASSADALRGSENYVKVKVKGTDCENGYDAGVADTKDLWRRSPNNSNCDNMWRFQDQADEMKDDNFPKNPSNWRDQTYNDCARNGVDDEVKSVEKKCGYDDTTQCNDLGNAAAERVVKDNWCPIGRNSVNPQDVPDWKAYCANEAVDICKGNIANVAKKWCPDEKMSGSDLNSLKNKCNDEVDDMTGEDTRRPPTPRPTRKPTPKPNSPNPRPTPKPNNRPVDRCGLNGKCGYCKQEYCPDTQERKDCKARLCSLEEELATTEIN